MLNVRQLAALLLIVSTTAHAAEPYIEVGVSGSELKTTGFLNRLSPSGKEFGEERSVGWRVAGGYRFSPYVAVEGGYADFGNKTIDSQFLSFSNSGAVSVDNARFDIKGPYAAVVGSASSGHWHPFAKIGVFLADTSVSGRVHSGGFF